MAIDELTEGEADRLTRIAIERLLCADEFTFNRIVLLVEDAKRRREALRIRKKQPTEYERARASVLWRDDFICQYCGFVGTWDKADGTIGVDHKVPSSRGGSDEASNLVACCRWCNSSKGTAIYPGEWRPASFSRGFGVIKCNRCERIRKWHHFGHTVADQAWAICDECFDGALGGQRK